jgi:hypothetical protein
MSNTLRRLYNRIDRLFDRQVLTQELRSSRGLEESNEPQTVRQVFERVWQAAQELDREACLKMIVSPGGVDQEGTSARWEFFFDLPQRRAKLECNWFLSWDDEKDGFGSACLDIIARPFPPANSLLRQMVNEGTLLHRQLAGFWEEERRRSPDLPLHFRNSNEAIVELIRQGLDLLEDEFSLGTGQSPEGKLAWIAQTRGREFYAELV